MKKIIEQIKKKTGHTIDSKTAKKLLLKEISENDVDFKKFISMAARQFSNVDLKNDPGMMQSKKIITRVFKGDKVGTLYVPRWAFELRIHKVNKIDNFK